MDRNTKALELYEQIFKSFTEFTDTFAVIVPRSAEAKDTFNRLIHKAKNLQQCYLIQTADKAAIERAWVSL